MSINKRATAQKSNFGRVINKLKQDDVMKMVNASFVLTKLSGKLVDANKQFLFTKFEAFVINSCPEDIF